MSAPKSRQNTFWAAYVFELADDMEKHPGEYGLAPNPCALEIAARSIATAEKLRYAVEYGGPARAFGGFQRINYRSSRAFRAAARAMGLPFNLAGLNSLYPPAVGMSAEYDPTCIFCEKGEPHEQVARQVSGSLFRRQRQVRNKYLQRTLLYPLPFAQSNGDILHAAQCVERMQRARQLAAGSAWHGGAGLVDQAPGLAVIREHGRYIELCRAAGLPDGIEQWTGAQCALALVLMERAARSGKMHLFRNVSTGGL